MKLGLYVKPGKGDTGSKPPDSLITAIKNAFSDASVCVGVPEGVLLPDQGWRRFIPAVKAAIRDGLAF